MEPRECSGRVLSLLALIINVVRKDEVLSTHVAENISTGDLGHLKRGKEADFVEPTTRASGRSPGQPACGPWASPRAGWPCTQTSAWGPLTPPHPLVCPKPHLRHGGLPGSPQLHRVLRGFHFKCLGGAGRESGVPQTVPSNPVAASSEEPDTLWSTE